MSFNPVLVVAKVEKPEWYKATAQYALRNTRTALWQLASTLLPYLLLLVTTFAGMVIGAKSLPPLNLVFWTLLGGFLAAGGSGAINQYIDREDVV